MLCGKAGVGMNIFHTQVEYNGNRDVDHVTGGFQVTSCTVKLAPEQTRPHFNVFKYDSQGEKSDNGVKNIKRMGKTI